jgi:hypothetical protein
MLPWQFSLRGLLVLVALTAIWCVAIINASPAWVMTTRGSSLMTLLFAMLAIWYRRGQKRAFWAGYLHGGGFYTMLVFYAVGGLGLRPICDDADIPSGRLAALLYNWLPEESRRPYEEYTPFPITRGRTLTGLPTRANESFIDPANFRYMFHSAFVLLAGYFGGLVGIWLYRTQDAPEGSAAGGVLKR